MKTLLLTLVVVTILCLDLGYTLICYNTPIKWISKTCAPEEKVCYFGSVMQMFLIRGCAEKCPKGYGCCRTDYCNK
uniref:Three-finger toxin n=1 Tax=Calliophis bivirgatus TaxID=8633 RepID=A0A898IN50_CALBG|nr:three-finger toxin [Calliophis bivirgatus]